MKVLVTRSDPVAGTEVTMEEQAMSALAGTPAGRRDMEHKWWERLWQAMPRVQKRKSSSTARAVERATKRQCKQDERQTEALLAKASDWRAHVFDAKSVKSVARKATLVKECLNEARALAKRKSETLSWLDCLPSGIRESKRLAPFLERWAQRAAHKVGKFMVERKDENDVSTDNEEDA
jgi:hypothetical protein